MSRTSDRPIVVAASDKFRGTATATEIADVVAGAASANGWRSLRRPVADGGEGLLEALGGPNRSTVVTGPLGDPVEAAWRLDGRTAVVEMATASGLLLAGGADGNDALSATTAGTGELIVEAAQAGARRIIVGVGGSATTDGGWGALRAMEPLARLRGVEIEVACDVRLEFVDAATRFGPQKGASPAQVQLLEGRLRRLGQVYEEQFGVDVTGLRHGGAAGGLAGGLAAVGATLRAGFDLVAEEVGLDDSLDGADLVVTGEGLLDDQSVDGKVVGGVIELAESFDVPVLVVVGAIAEGDQAPPALDGVEVVSLAARYGIDAAMSRTAELVGEVVTERLARG